MSDTQGIVVYGGTMSRRRVLARVLSERVGSAVRVYMASRLAEVAKCLADAHMIGALMLDDNVDGAVLEVLAKAHVNVLHIRDADGDNVVIDRVSELVRDAARA